MGPSQPERTLSVLAVTPTKEGAKGCHHRDRRPGVTPGPGRIWGPSLFSTAETGHSDHHGERNRKRQRKSKTLGIFLKKKKNPAYSRLFNSKETKMSLNGKIKSWLFSLTLCL